MRRTCSLPANWGGSVLYFFIEGSYGIAQTFLPLIWISKGLSEREVGFIGSIAPTTLLVLNPLLCSLADRYGIHKEMLRFSFFLWGVFGTSMVFAGGLFAVALIETASGVSNSPTFSLANACVIKTYGRKEYPVQRAWGAAGGAVITLVSSVIAGTEAGYTGVMITFAGVVATAYICVGFLPEENMQYHHQPDTENGERYAMNEKGTLSNSSPSTSSSLPPKVQENGTASPEDTGVMLAIRIILGSPQIASFYASSFLGGVASAIIDTFLFIRIAELGGSSVIIGIAKLMTYTGELPCFYFSGLLIERAGFRGTMALTAVAFIVRFTYYSQLRDPWMVLPIEPLHGLTFALMWSVTVQYSDHIAPSHIKATMQGLSYSIVWGLGVGCGAIMGGFLYGEYGASLCFAYSAVLPSVALLLLLIGGSVKHNAQGAEKGGNGRGKGDNSTQRYTAPEGSTNEGFVEQELMLQVM